MKRQSLAAGLGCAIQITSADLTWSWSDDSSCMHLCQRGFCVETDSEDNVKYSILNS